MTLLDINEYLGPGPENAKTTKYLCSLLGINARDLARSVEFERRHGIPICASLSRYQPGYFLARDQQEMIRYCKTLERRIRELTITREACLKALEHLPVRCI